MTSYLWILVLAALSVSRAQDDLSLFDALDDDEPTPPPVKPPKAGGDGNIELDLSDALGPDIPEKPKKPAGDPSKTGDSSNFDITDAFDNDPKKPSGGGGGGFDDSDLGDVAGNGDYKPDPGQGGRGGARAGDSNYDNSGGGEQGAQGGQMAGIISAVGVAILGAASSYFAYQKKKLCFKIQGGADPESGTNQAGTHSEPQVLSNLLKSSS
ncbi:CD99 molecule isoform X2 [Astyanax mexicanus]|uniref:CD99 molecule isoform X2 n=1 Tax=Astyanax mexicanus TaxID=7994 RepID=UPI0020CAE101|nr:CD99 molecule isoform X2 [Astyanax mexicanus]